MDVRSAKTGGRMIVYTSKVVSGFACKAGVHVVHLELWDVLSTDWSQWPWLERDGGSLGEGAFLLLLLHFSGDWAGRWELWRYWRGQSIFGGGIVHACAEESRVVEGVV